MVGQINLIRRGSSDSNRQWDVAMDTSDDDESDDNEDVEMDDKEMEMDDDDDDDDMDMRGLTVAGMVPETISRSSSAALSGISCPSDFIHSYGTHCEVPTAHRKIKLLYVPDPSRARLSREDAMIDLGWVRRHVTADQLSAIKDLKGVQYKVPKPTKVERSMSGTLMLLTEWVGHFL